MIKNRCLFCGSINLRADRALSGRLVCTSCGTPYGVRKAGRSIRNNFNFSPINRKTFVFISLLFFVFLLVVF